MVLGVSPTPWIYLSHKGAPLFQDVGGDVQRLMEVRHPPLEIWGEPGGVLGSPPGVWGVPRGLGGLRGGVRGV